MVFPEEVPGCCPRLVYIGDVPVESSYHGSALLYRLLQNYPGEKLQVVEGGQDLSLPERRLSAVQYWSLRHSHKRWLNTRFHRQVSSWFSLTARSRVYRLPRLIGDFAAQAVLTVAHGYSWLTAAAYARQKDLPLHLVVHDDWPRVARLIGPLPEWLDREFGRIYRQAASRFCVSPFMVEEYERRYGIRGRVLYPSRMQNFPQFDSPPERVRASGKTFTMAFAGTLNTVDYLRQLSILAKLLGMLNGRLMLFGPYQVSDLSAAGLLSSNVKLNGLLPSLDIVHRLRDECDALFLPMSFAPDDAGPMALSFPSKLSDYTATGLPILIWGPEGSSAVKWAKENPGVAIVVTSLDENVMAVALARLAENPKYRWHLGVAALQIGNQYFAVDRAEAMFKSALQSGLSSG